MEVNNRLFYPIMLTILIIQCVSVYFWLNEKATNRWLNFTIAVGIFISMVALWYFLNWYTITRHG
ncbi:hypothetical protein GGR92_000312 [Spirosoma lacussanchae]